MPRPGDNVVTTYTVRPPRSMIAPRIVTTDLNKALYWHKGYGEGATISAVATRGKRALWKSNKFYPTSQTRKKTR